MSEHDDDDLLRQAREWLAGDPDQETKDELNAFIDAANDEKNADRAADALVRLRRRFEERLSFGTAGLRGPLGAGPNAMNRVIVAQTAAGLAAYLNKVVHDGETPSVVIGYDARKNSHIFAIDTAEIMAGAGIRTTILPTVTPTPVLAFSVRHLVASAGVMVTASHNPATDSGYKVYLGGYNNGAQIVSPVDTEISQKIDEVAAQTPVAELSRSNNYETAGGHVLDSYVSATAAIVSHSPRSQPTVVYTPMHGVGWETMQKVFTKAGFTVPIAVDEQRVPDERFSTLPFPNPEEAGALDLAFKVARENSADFVLANDPDADRLAVAIPEKDSPEGFRRLGGSEVGALLALQAAENELFGVGALACSVVSSPVMRPIADAYHLDFIETLTGFKWVSRVPGLVFGFEEALGYLVNPGTVKDKDGISAALAIMSLASDLAAEGLSLSDQLDRLSERFGVFASSQVSFRRETQTQLRETMESLRRMLPLDVGGLKIMEIDDFRDGFGDLPPADLLRFYLEDHSRIMVRPSGTEPKLKFYIDVEAHEGSLAEQKAATRATIATLERGVRELFAQHSPDYEQ